MLTLFYENTYDYFYQLLYQYISFYIFPGDRIVKIDPKSSKLFDQFSNVTKKVLFLDEPGDLENYESLSGLSDLKSFKPSLIILNGNLHFVRDIQAYLQKLRGACENHTRLIVTYYSIAWRPAMKIATFLGIRKKTPEQNWIAHEDIRNLLYISDFEVVKRDNRVLVPFYIPLLSNFLNRYVAPLPFFRLFTMVNILLARPTPILEKESSDPSVSVIIPARNEYGNIENAIVRLPKMGPDDEVIFVEGNSTDHTWEKIQEIKTKYGQEFKVKIAKQEGRGKGDAVRKGFSIATKDILMILDADLTVPPEDLSKFYQTILTKKGEFINGSRLVYPMEKSGMPFLNIIANKFFASAFSYVLGQPFKDTLCGTKVLSRKDYIRIDKFRSYFGDFDPFGDFDLIFGASRLGLRIVEVPIAYKQRTYGKTNIQRWKHGIILLRMLFFAARKIKFI